MLPNSYISRELLKSSELAKVSFCLVAAERPDLNTVLRSIDTLVSIAPKPNNLNKLKSLIKLWNEDKFKDAIYNFKKDLEGNKELQSWAIPDKLNQELFTYKIFSTNTFSIKNKWTDNLIALLSSIRKAQLRSIAKKGVDLDDFSHFKSFLPPENDSSFLIRTEVSIELLALVKIKTQAKSILARALEIGKFEADGSLHIHCSRPVKDYESKFNSFNFLTFNYANKIQQALQELALEYPGRDIFIHDFPVMMLTRTNRTNAAPLGRILHQPIFQKSDYKNKNILITDDHINAGAITKSLASQALQEGARLIGIAAFSCHPHSQSILIDAELYQYMKDSFSEQKLNKFLQAMGLSLRTLTNREALTLCALLMNKNQPKELQKFKYFNQKLKGEYSNILEGINDDLKTVLHKRPLSFSDLMQLI